MRKFALMLLAAMFSLNASAQTTLTPNVGLQLPAYGSTSWQVPFYFDMNLIDQYLSGVKQFPFPNCTNVGYVLTSTGTGWTCAPSSGGGGGVIPGTQYHIPQYNNLGTNVGNSNITTDSTGNNLAVPGGATFGAGSGLAVTVDLTGNAGGTLNTPILNGGSNLRYLANGPLAGGSIPIQYSGWATAHTTSGIPDVLSIDASYGAGAPTVPLISGQHVIDWRGTNNLGSGGNSVTPGVPRMVLADGALGIYHACTAVASYNLTTYCGNVDFMFDEPRGGKYTFSSGGGAKANANNLLLTQNFYSPAQHQGIFSFQQSYSGGESIGYSLVQTDRAGNIGPGQEPNEGWRQQQQQGTESDGKVTGTYTSGIAATGPPGSRCALSNFQNGNDNLTASVALTATDTIGTGAALIITEAGGSSPAGTTTATTVAVDTVNPATTCTGTATVSLTAGIGGMWNGTVTAINSGTGVVSFTPNLNAQTLGATRFIRDLNSAYSTGTIVSAVGGGSPFTTTITGSGTNWTSIPGFVGTHSTFTNLAIGGPLLTTNLCITFAPSAVSGFDWTAPITAGIDDTHLTVNLLGNGTGVGTGWPGGGTGHYTIHGCMYPGDTDQFLQTIIGCSVNNVGTTSCDTSGIGVGHVVDQVQAYNQDEQAAQILVSHMIGRPNYGGGIFLTNLSPANANPFNAGFEVSGNFLAAFAIGYNGTAGAKHPQYGIYNYSDPSTAYWYSLDTSGRSLPAFIFRDSTSAQYNALNFNKSVGGDPCIGFFGTATSSPTSICNDGITTATTLNVTKNLNVNGSATIGGIMISAALFAGPYSNQILDSNFQGTTNWTIGVNPGSSYVQNAGPDIFGGTTAGELIAGSTGATLTQTPGGNLVAGNTYAWSFYLAAATNPIVFTFRPSFTDTACAPGTAGNKGSYAIQPGPAQQVTIWCTASITSAEHDELINNNNNAGDGLFVSFAAKGGMPYCVICTTTGGFVKTTTVPVSGLGLVALGVPVTSGISYPGAGIPNSTGTAWGTSYTAQGTDTALLTAGTVSGSGALLCTDANGGATTVGCTGAGGGNLSNSGTPTANQLGVFVDATHLGGSNAIPNGTTATTQTAGDNSTKIATTAYVNSAVPAAPPTFLGGLIETVTPGGASGALITQQSFESACAAQTVAQASASSTQPTVVNFTSAAVGGDCSGWTGGVKNYAMSRQPLQKFGISYPGTADFGSTNSSLIWAGLFGTCTAATMEGSGTPAGCDIVAIRFVPGTDTVYQCVTSTAGTQTTTPIPSATPQTAIQIATINIGPSSATCTVGANSVTVSTNLPASTILLSDIFVNVAKTTTAVHLNFAGVQGISQNGNF